MRHNTTLPNGLAINDINPYETAFVYNEVFVHETYLQNNVTLRPDACVFDIGANIGLFSLYIKTKCPTARVYAFEPAPVAFDCLQRNLGDYIPGFKAQQVAVTDQDGEAILGYYPGYSVISGLETNVEVDSNILVSGMTQYLMTHEGVESRSIDISAIEAIVSERLQAMERIPCQTRSISSLLREYQENYIDLLKIDAERSETLIVHGIAAEDWERIHQIVMEVHDRKTLDLILPILYLHGFSVITSADVLISGVFTLSATNEQTPKPDASK